MKPKYSSLLDAINDLTRKGYTTDIEAAWNELGDASKFHIVETHRFEGISNPDDNAILYEILIDGGRKGMLVDGYGTTASGEVMKIISRIEVERKEQLSK